MIAVFYFALGIQYSKCVRDGLAVDATSVYYAWRPYNYLLSVCHAAIIIPTAWDYLRIRFNAGNKKWLYSLTISAANAVSVIVGPLFGAVYDKSHTCKALVLISVVSSVVGKDEKSR